MLTRMIGRLRASPLGYRLASGAFWSMAGTLVSRALTLAGSVVVARVLGKEGYGELGIVQSTVGLFTLFAGFGMGLTATRYVAEFRDRDPPRAGRIIALSHRVCLVTGGIFTIALAAMAPWLAARTLAAPHLENVLRIGSLMLVLSAWSGSQTGALSGFEAFRRIARINVWTTVVSVPLTVLGVCFLGLVGAVLGLVVTTLVNCILNDRALSAEARARGISRSASGCWRERRILGRFSLPVVLAGCLAGPVSWACAALLVNQPGGYAQMGLFNVANQWRWATMLVPSILNQVLLPVMASLGESAEGRARQSSVVEHAQSSIVMAIFPLAALLMFGAPLILSFYGPTFADGDRVMAELSAAMMIASIGVATGAALQARERMWIGFGINLVYGAGLVAVAWWLTPRLGAEALAFGTAAGYAVTTVWTFAVLAREMPAGMLPRVGGAIGFTAAMLAAGLAVSPRLRPWLAVPAFLLSAGFVYGVLLSEETKRRWRGLALGREEAGRA